MSILRGRVVTTDHFGPPAEVLKVVERSTRELGPGEVLVHMVARPINWSDLLTIAGAYASRTRLPLIPGYEGVGTVAALGPDVDGMDLGRRVLPLRGEGTWQDFVIAPAEFCIAVPDAFDDLVAAQLYINPMTAWFMLQELSWLQAGDVIAVNAAGSAIAAVLMRFAAASGIHSIALVRHPRHTRRLDSLGAMAVVDTSAVSLRQAIMALTRGKGLAAAFDAIGGEMGAALANCLRPGGAMLHYGLLSGEPLPAELAQMIGEGRQIRLFWLRNWRSRATTVDWHASFGRMMAAMETCKVALPAAACLDLAQVQAAVAAAGKSGRNGKIILTA